MKKAIVLFAVVALLFATAAPGEAHWRPWWPGAVIGGLALGAAIAATAPWYYYPPPPPVYAYPAPPPVVYQPAPAPAPAPLVQREVVYPHGRHVLYGDGVTRPWQWVWVPNR